VTMPYRRFRCRCGKQFNERSGSVLNKAQYPSDVIALVVFWRLRDLAEMFLTRGFIFTYGAVREWEAKLTPALAENLRRKPEGRVGHSRAAKRKAPINIGSRNSAPPRPIRPPNAPIIAPPANAAVGLRGAAPGNATVCGVVIADPHGGSCEHHPAFCYGAASASAIRRVRWPADRLRDDLSPWNRPAGGRS
jgi:hypothetical protein